MSKPHATSARHPLIALIDELVRLRGRLQSVFAGATAVMGLSAMESTVLTAVIESQTPPTVSQIGRSLGHPRQVVQRAANALIDAKLVEIRSNPHHKRAPLLHATAAGKKSYQDAATFAERAASSLAHLLDLRECERLARELHELRSKIEAHLRERPTAKLRFRSETPSIAARRASVPTRPRSNRRA